MRVTVMRNSAGAPLNPTDSACPIVAGIIWQGAPPSRRNPPRTKHRQIASERGSIRGGIVCRFPACLQSWQIVENGAEPETDRTRSPGQRSAPPALPKAGKDGNNPGVASVRSEINSPPGP
ncbi:hypothetical protein GCM10008966_11990 [Rhodovulum strictum]